MRAGLDGSGYVNGARVITRANLDIMDSTSRAQGAMTALEGGFSGIGSRANTGFGAARAAVESMNSPLAGMKSMIEQVESRIIRIGATVLIFRALGSAIGAVSSFFSSGLKNVQEYNDILIAMSASLTQIAIMNNAKDKSGKSTPQMYAESAKYAGVLAEKMREVDINSSANYDQIMAMLQVYTATGRVLDVNNKRQVDGFTALSNAIPIMTKGQDVTRQMTTEMRAFATGTLTAGSTIAKMVDSMAKADGVTGGLKELIKIGDASGKSVLEVAAKYLEGFTAAIPAIAKTITTAKTSFETAVGAAQRKVFAPIVADLVMVIQGAIKEVGDGTTTVANLVQSAWLRVKTTLFDVATITSSSGKISEILVIKPEIMEELKTFGNAVKWVGLLMREATMFVVEHIGVITQAGVAWLARKAIIATVGIATALFTKTVAESIIVEESAESIANRRNQAEGARMERLAASTALQTAKNEASLKAAAAEVTNTEALRNSTSAEMARNSETLSGIRTRGMELEIEVELAASRLASATAYYEANYKMNASRTFNVESAQMELIARKELTASELEFTAAKTALQSKYLYGLELQAQEIALIDRATAAKLAYRSALITSMLPEATNAAIRYNAVLAAEGITLGAVTGAQLANNQASFAMANPVRQAIMYKTAYTEALVINGTALGFNSTQMGLLALSTEASLLSNIGYSVQLAVSTVASYALTAATAVLKTALSLVGGVLGVVALALYIGYKAWSNYGSAAEEAIKKASGIAKTNKEVVEGIKEEIRVKELAISTATKLEEAAKNGIKPKFDPEEANYIKFGSDYSKFTKMRSDLRDMETTYFRMKSDDNFAKEELGGKFSQFWDTATGKYVISEAQFNSMRKEINAATKSLSDFEKLADTGKLKTPVTKSMVQPPTVDKKAGNESESAYNTLIKLQDSYQIAAIKSGKVTDELSSKLEAIDAKYDNDMERTKAAYLTHPKSSALAVAYIESQKEIQKANAIVEDTKKGQAALDTANRLAATQELKSNLALEKSALVEQLADNLITHSTYTEKIKANITSETDLYLSEIEKQINAKEVEQSTVGYSEGHKLLIQADLTKLYSEYVEKQKAGATLIHKANSDEIKDIEAKRNALVELQNSAVDANLTLASSRASHVGTSSATGAITDQVANTSAIADAEYNKELERIGRTDRMLQKKYDNNILNEKALAAIREESAANLAMMDEAALARSQKIAAAKLSEDQKTYDSLASVASKTFPKIQGFQQLATIAGRKYDEQMVKSGEGKDEKLVSSGKLSAKGQKQLIGDVAGFGESMFQGLADSQDKSSRSGFEAAKAYSLGAAVMSTAQAIMNQMSGGDPYTAWARAALAGAMGAIQIATIAGTEYGGGSGVVSAPTSSFASGGSTANSGLSNYSTPLSSVQDSQTQEDLTRLSESMDNVAVGIGRLSKSMDSLAALFKDSGTGTKLGVNAPGKYETLSEVPTTVQSIYNGIGAMSFIRAAQALFSFNLKKLGDALNPVNIWNSAMNAVFGGGVSTTGAGISLGYNKGQVTGQNYVTKKEDGGWFSSDKSWTEMSNNSDLQAFVSSLIKPYTNDIVRMAATLGTTTGVASYTAAPTNIATAGRSTEDISKDLEAWTLKTLEGMALTVVGLKEVVGAYDNAYEMLTKYNDALVSTNDAFELIGKTQVQGSLKTAEFLSNVQDNLFGGLDGFNTAIDTYFTSLFTDEQQTAMKAAQATNEVNRAFTEMGIAVPSTNAKFISLVNSLDVTTVTGATTFAALMSISEAFGTMTSTLDSTKTAQTSLNKDLLSRYMEADGYTGAAVSLAELRISQQRELNDATKQGLDTTALAIVQQMEFGNALLKPLKDLSTALHGMIDGAVTYTTKQAFSIVGGALNSGDLSNTTQLTAAAKVLNGLTSDNYSTSLSYQRDKALSGVMVTNLTTMTDAQISDTQRTLEVAQNQLAALTNIFEEIKALRNEIKTVATATTKSLTIFDKWDGDGMPAVAA